MPAWTLRPFHYLWISLLSIAVVFILSLWYVEPASVPFFSQRVPERERVIQQHCGSCHLPVSASALDKETWLNSVLPAMATKVGINKIWGNYYTAPNHSGVTASRSEWEQIIEYYRREAPDTLLVPDPPSSLQTELPGFSVRKPPPLNNRRPATALVAVDDSTGHIYSSDTVTETIYQWKQNLTSSDVVQSDVLGVAAHFLTDAKGHRHRVFTSIGSTMNPIDRATGTVFDVPLGSPSNRVIARELPRPVCSVPGDFNQDGLRDWIVCGFGHTIGGLYLVTQQSDGSFAKTEIRDVPGAVDAHVQDFNRDGYPDVMVLFGHGNEGVWLFTNDRKGGFDQRNVLRFPPVYGSTNFQLADFNGDDRLDLLYTSGDNADFSKILKPYHGIYIFLNQGDFQFEQSYFYHLNGATEAIASDFDGDGDLDIAAIAYFADLKNDAARNFVYLEQEAPLEFTPHAPPLQRYGRWLNMDLGDYDGDDDLDLVLGNFSRYYLNQRRSDSDSSLPFIVLENERR